MIGKIHSIETMGSVDGPGLRYIVFLQGCSMRCIYCHNRDTWDASGGMQKDSAKILEQVKSLESFYKRNNGGITVTGGEPLLQAAFVEEIFKGTKTLGLTTALDTAGNVPLTQNVKNTLDLTNYLLMDVKSLVEKKHKEITGVSTKLVKPFMDYVRDKKINTWLRYVYIPGYTDSMEDLNRLSEFIIGFPSISRIDILPYHSLGKEKWTELGYSYPLENLQQPKEKDVEEFRNSLRQVTSVVVK